MADICSTEGCQLKAKYEGKCSLHCTKCEYSLDLSKGVLIDFYEQLAEYILKKWLDTKSSFIDENFSHKLKIRAEVENGFDSITEKYINEITKKEAGDILKAIDGTDIVFRGINFPDRKDDDDFDYFNLIRTLRGAFFESSIIQFGIFNISNVKVFFKECEFNHNWLIHSYSLPDNVASKTVFHKCTFNRNVNIAPLESTLDELKIKDHLFQDCYFLKNVNINRGHYIKKIFNNSTSFIQKLQYLNIEKCEFEGRFELNNAVIKLLTITNMEFSEKFELKENNIANAVISNVNFKKLFDAYKTKFIEFKIRRSIFHDFTGFEKCEFGLPSSKTDQPTEFEYVTFLDFTNFRKAKFHNGLDFEHTNIKEPLNFLNAEISDLNTNRPLCQTSCHPLVFT